MWRLRLWWEQHGVSLLVWVALAACFLALAFVLLRAGNPSGALGYQRFYTNAPVLRTHHLEVRACRYSTGAATHVRLFVANHSMLRISNLHLRAHLDGLPPLNAPAPIRGLRPAVVAKAGAKRPAIIHELELQFPPPANKRLWISVRYTVEAMPPLERTASNEAFLQPCR
ncbi:MAG: hypothetical protein RMK45_01300 [Armatimonadota bacterium]|nr:hypothetical protein [Armatimonadota bacterium]